MSRAPTSKRAPTSSNDVGTPIPESSLSRVPTPNLSSLSLKNLGINKEHKDSGDSVNVPEEVGGRWDTAVTQAHDSGIGVPKSCPNLGVPQPQVRPRGYNADNVTDYVQSDGSRQAMTAVLRDRAELVRLRGRKRMDAAYRLRAEMIGVLGSCLCDYPLQAYETTSGHHMACPSQALFESAQEAR